MLRWKRLLLGVTGGIAAYKAADLASKLVKQGAEVHVGMTAHATEFVTPLTFQALTGNQVISDMFAPVTSVSMTHIDLARRVDGVVVAPCTANMIGKIIGGIADDWLSTTILATQAPVLICPAMNTRMFDNRIVQANLARLKEFGFHVAPTGYGDLACGEKGSGRLIEVEQIIEFIQMMLAEKDLTGLKILVTAGPTREHLDPVRYISNPSTGKMGYACARVAARRGAEVVLVSGPSELPPPVGVRLIKVTAAEEMLQACLAYYPQVDVVIKAAAVADHGPRETRRHKIKKSEEAASLELIPRPDILKLLGQQKTCQFLVGFAAETQSLVDHARTKLAEKNLDLIVANDVAQAGAGFGTDTNIVKILSPDGHVQELPLLPKEEVAEIVLDRVLDLVRKRGG
jgi:phosphopantothenoylcysteine decarboxylase/phosphopantothenate--cysteine ligase